MKSNEYKNWISLLDLKTCSECRIEHGKIYLAKETIDPEPPIHYKCRCTIKWLDSLYAGTATNRGIDGADWWLKNKGHLPDYYITLEQARAYGYKPHLGNLSKILPGKMLTKGKYRNKEGRLPMAVGRIWYEADINYTYGNRSAERILFSNDGLIFVTYNHYQTFKVII